MHTRACASKQIGKADDTSLLVPESTYVRVMNGHCRDDVSRSQDTNFIISPTKVDGFDCYFGILSVGFYTTTSFFCHICSQIEGSLPRQSKSPVLLLQT